MRKLEATNRVVRALDKVAGFTRTRTATNFVDGWAPLWCDAARAVRDDADPLWVLSMPLPEDPAFVVARELFQIAIDNADIPTMTAALAAHMQRLKPAKGEEWLNHGAGLTALRAFFRMAVREVQRRSGPVPDVPSKRNATADRVHVNSHPPEQMEVTIWDQEWAEVLIDGSPTKNFQGTDLSDRSWARLLELAADGGVLHPPNVLQLVARWTQDVLERTGENPPGHSTGQQRRTYQRERDTWDRQTRRLGEELRSLLMLDKNPISKKRGEPHCCLFGSIRSDWTRGDEGNADTSA